MLRPWLSVPSVFLLASLVHAVNTKHSVLEKSRALRHAADLLDSLHYDLAHSAMPVSAASLEGLQLLQRSPEFSPILDKPSPQDEPLKHHGESRKHHHDTWKHRSNGHGFRGSIFTTEQNLSPHDPATVQTLAAKLREAALDAAMKDDNTPQRLTNMATRGGAALQANVGRATESIRSGSHSANLPANFWTEVNPADMPHAPLEHTIDPAGIQFQHVPLEHITEEPAQFTNEDAIKKNITMENEAITEEGPAVKLISNNAERNSVKSVKAKKGSIISIHSMGIIILVVLIVLCVSLFIYFRKLNRKQCENIRFMGPYPPAKIAARNLTEANADDDTVQFAPSRRMANKQPA